MWNVEIVTVRCLVTTSGLSPSVPRQLGFLLSNTHTHILYLEVSRLYSPQTQIPNCPLSLAHGLGLGLSSSLLSDDDDSGHWWSMNKRRRTSALLPVSDNTPPRRGHAQSRDYRTPRVVPNNIICGRTRAIHSQSRLGQTTNLLLSPAFYLRAWLSGSTSTSPPLTLSDVYGVDSGLCSGN